MSFCDPTTVLVGAACLAFALFVLSERWRMLALHYAGKPRGALQASKALDSLVLERPGGYGRRYAINPTAVGVYSGGLALRSVFPLQWFKQPLFLPFDEMQLRPTSWPGLTDPHAVRMARTDDVEVVLSSPQLRWIRDNGGPI